MADITRIPIDAATRGKLRLWKADLARRYRIINPDVDRDVEGFAARGSVVGRQRAFQRLARSIAPSGAVLEGVRFTGNHPIAVWSVLKPRDPVMVDEEDPARQQDCVVVEYLVVARLGGYSVKGCGLWTLEVPDHALGRLMQRCSADPAACIRQAHHAALRLRRSDVSVESRSTFLLPAGPGAFVCQLHLGRDRSMDEEPIMYIGAITWLSEDMLWESQTPIIDDGGPGYRLGDDWLLPAPLRVPVDTEGGITVAAWAPGMPETLASTGTRH